jgi:formylglycine-generating enzyme required for sulfatase activity
MVMKSRSRLALSQAVFLFSTVLHAQPHALNALLDGSGFVQIPAGEFVMGSAEGNADEQPEHRVQITRPFEMSKYETTQAQWDAIMLSPHVMPTTKARVEGVNPSHFKGPTLPVENVTWNNVQEFIRLLNLRDPKHNYRLPTEAEWEYAARAKDEEDLPSDLEAFAWFEPNSQGKTQPVGQKKPNPFGLYDMHGNVREWVQDWYAPDSYSASPVDDPPGPASGSYRVYRGGSWHSAAKYCRTTFRGFDFPANDDYSVGFRLVRTGKL